MQFSLMIWGCFTYYGVGTITVVDGNINAQKNIDIIDEHLWQVVARHFPRNNYIFNFKVENNIHFMVWPAHSPDLNIIENV